MVIVVLGAIVACSGCGLGLVPHETAAIQKGRILLSYLTKTHDIQLFAGDDPAVIDVANNLWVDAIDGSKTSMAVIPRTHMLFLSPGQHVLEVRMYAKLSVSEVEGGTKESDSDRKRDYIILGDLTIRVEQGKRYKMWFEDNTVKLLPVTDAETDAKINALMPKYHEMRASALKWIQEQDMHLGRYIAYAKEHPNILEGKWVNDLTSLTQTFEFHGDKMTFTFDSILLDSTLHGTFLYDENTIIPFVSTMSWALGDTHKNTPPHKDLNPVYYYTLSGDTLELKQDNYLSDMPGSQTGKYVRSH
jgi:hypothetical protein